MFPMSFTAGKCGWQGVLGHLPELYNAQRAYEGVNTISKRLHMTSMSQFSLHGRGDSSLGYFQV